MRVGAFPRLEYRIYIKFQSNTKTLGSMYCETAKDPALPTSALISAVCKSICHFNLAGVIRNSMGVGL
jgi:hypothetical protein